jgi:uncharacterized membrane protein YuzA (DUF378 family)
MANMEPVKKHFLLCGFFVLVAIVIYVANWTLYFAAQSLMVTLFGASPALGIFFAIYGLASVFSPLFFLPHLLPDSIGDSEEAGAIMGISVVAGLLIFMFLDTLPWID